MREILYILFFVLISSPALAAKVVILRTNAQNLRLIDTLEKTSDGYFLSGKNIGKKLSPSKQKSWNEIQKLAIAVKGRSIASLCSAGHFAIIFEQNGKKTVSKKGCFDDQAYQKIIPQLKKLRSL